MTPDGSHRPVTRRLPPWHVPPHPRWGSRLKTRPEGLPWGRDRRLAAMVPMGTMRKALLHMLHFRILDQAGQKSGHGASVSEVTKVRCTPIYPFGSSCDRLPPGRTPCSPSLMIRPQNAAPCTCMRAPLDDCCVATDVQRQRRIESSSGAQSRCSLCSSSRRSAESSTLNECLTADESPDPEAAVREQRVTLGRAHGLACPASPAACPLRHPCHHHGQTQRHSLSG